MDIYFDEGSHEDYYGLVAGYEEDDYDEDAYCEIHEVSLEACYDDHEDD